jgi:hypothetical protein
MAVDPSRLDRGFALLVLDLLATKKRHRAEKFLQINRLDHRKSYLTVTANL